MHSKLNKDQNSAKFSALLNLGNLEITIKEFKEGWEKYEYRWKETQEIRWYGRLMIHPCGKVKRIRTFFYGENKG